MKIRLGYACISNAIKDTSSSNLTYSYFKKLGNLGYDKLESVITSNLKSLEKILKYNVKNDIYFYRMSSRIIPLLTHPNVNIDLNKYKAYFVNIGKIINDNKMRVDLHIDPYYVLNSVNNNVVQSTINICKIYRNMFNLMKIKSNIIFHIGGKTISKEEGIKRFIKNYNLLDKDIKDLIIIENDDKIYNILDCIEISKKTSVKICVDYHHFKCNNCGENIKDYLKNIFSVYKELPKMHFSSPKSKKEFRAHSEYVDVKEFVDFLSILKEINMDLDIMIEAKMKDDALFRLVRQLKYLNYKVKGTTIYI